MNLLSVRAVRAIALFLCPIAFAQTTASSITPASVVQQGSARKDFRVGRTEGRLYTWRITDVRSPYYGLTLVWLEIRESTSFVFVEKTNNRPIPNTPVDANTLAVLSGGSWTGRYDSPLGAKQASGLVITSGSVVSPLTIEKNGSGGVLWACNNDLRFADAAEYSKMWRGRLPCPAVSALQTSALVIKNGKPGKFSAGEKANRLAIGQDADKIIIAGAFTSFGTALSLPEFASYVAAAAKELGRKNLNALNLDGACSAQLLIPPLQARFGCDTPGFSINRIVVRPKP